MLPWKRHYESGISKEMPFQNPKSAFLWRASNDFVVHAGYFQKSSILFPTTPFMVLEGGIEGIKVFSFGP